jgi:hypothetical protein
MPVHSAEPRLYSVSARDKAPLVGFIRDALESCGCRMLHVPEPNAAPFRFTFETREGERMGVIVYAFLANSAPTRNRPPDEHRFQVKYGTKDNELHEIWQDPYSLYTTLFCGIDPERGMFVGADPSLVRDTAYLKCISFSRAEAEAIRVKGWHGWERDRDDDSEGPIEVLVGGTSVAFLHYVYFEREALFESAGERQLLAERFGRVLAKRAQCSVSMPQRGHG